MAKRLWGGVALSLGLLGGLAWGQSEPPKARQDALLYLLKQDCGSCHGLTLKGGLGPNLTRERLQGRSALAISRVILDGIPDTAMPPWRPFMSEAEALWLADRLLKGATDAR